jgi:hypothetical protein
LPSATVVLFSLTTRRRFCCSGTWQNSIRAALRHIESETCIRFEENGNGNDYVEYFRGSGCWSSVGRVGGRQQASIGYGCENVS